MPELPEVEHFRRLLLPLMSSTLTLELMKDNPPKRFLTSDDVKDLTGKCIIEDILRKGKLIAILLSCPEKVRNQEKLYLFVHMGMTGRISTPDHVPILESLAASDYPPPYTYLKLRTDKAEASFSDPRKFGSITIGTTLEEGFGTLAIDALDIEIADIDRIAGKTTKIKEILLDQKRVMSGVGNWVADEVLYQCEIHPMQSYLNDEQALRIIKTLKSILNTAIELYDVGKALPMDWLFHVRWSKRAATNGETIKDFKGRLITFLTAAGRTSAIVPSIQRNMKSAKPKKSETPTQLSLVGSATAEDIVKPIISQAHEETRRQKEKGTTTKARKGKEIIKKEVTPQILKRTRRAPPDQKEHEKKPREVRSTRQKTNA